MRTVAGFLAMAVLLLGSWGCSGASPVALDHEAASQDAGGIVVGDPPGDAGGAVSADADPPANEDGGSAATPDAGQGDAGHPGQDAGDPPGEDAGEHDAGPADAAPPPAVDAAPELIPCFPLTNTPAGLGMCLNELGFCNSPYQPFECPVNDAGLASLPPGTPGSCGSESSLSATGLCYCCPN
jgi:hypothetical protein